MPIPLNHKLKRITKVVRLKDNLKDNDNELMVWSYCGIYKNHRDQSQPHVLVAFRELISGSLSDKAVFRRMPLTSLGQLRIGTVWQDNVCCAEAFFDSPKESFPIDFTKGAWKLTSFYEAIRNDLSLPYPQDIYPPQHPTDKNWFLEFKLPSGGKLLIPCIEFFSRCYGQSGELKRILATYPWDTGSDTAKGRLYAPLDEPEERDKWKVKLKRRLLNGDVVLLAHAKYDRYTENTCKSIYGQIEAQHDPADKKPAFIKVAPWFQGPAQLKVKGIWFDNKKSFLALQIIGCSDPDGVMIQRDRENTNKVDSPAEGTDEGSAWKGAPQRKLVKLPEIVDLTGDEEPDHDAFPIEIQDPDFVVLGQPRLVIDARKDYAKGTAGERKNGTEANKYSSGEPHGNKKGVGHASIHAPQILESHGALRDTWNAMLHLMKKHPASISSVEWYTFQGGFNSTPEPKLNGLQPFGKDENVSTEERNWLYCQGSIPRGILIARIIANGKSVYIVEIERRPRTKKDKNGNEVEAETFRGFVFVLDDQRHLIPWLKKLMSDIRSVNGVVKNLVHQCPGKADTFKHPPASSGATHCEKAVINALDKVGVTL